MKQATHTHTIEELQHDQHSRAQSRSIYLSTDGTGELVDVQSNVQERLQDTESKVTTGAAKTKTRWDTCNTTVTRTAVRRRHLAEVGVKVHHAVAELLHVLRQQLVYVGYPVVQVAHLVVGEAPAAGRAALRDQEDATLGGRRPAALLTAGIRRTASW